MRPYRLNSTQNNEINGGSGCFVQNSRFLGYHNRHIVALKSLKKTQGNFLSEIISDRRKSFNIKYKTDN